jgi:type VI secretion system secreted protein Hcp
MAVDVFLKLGDIKGESKDSKHAGEIDVLSWSFGVSQTGTMGHGGGGGAGKANFSDLNIMHAVDKSSPVLMTKCAVGEHIKEGTLVSRKAGKGQQEYLIIKMNDVIITSVSLSADDAAASAEHVALQFAKVDLEYKPQKADGSLDAGLHFKYDIKGNKEG